MRSVGAGGTSGATGGNGGAAGTISGGMVEHFTKREHA
jgi:hypothetical protein